MPKAPPDGKVEFVRRMCVACFDWAGPLAADYEHILDQLTLEGFAPNDSANYYTARAYRAFMRGDPARQRVYWDSARMVTERMLRAAADTLALILADSNVYFITRASVAVDPFWQKLQGVRSFEEVVKK